jgi:hypothetical protein
MNHPPQPRPVPPPSGDPAVLLDQLRDALTNVERGLAGFSLFSKSLLAATGQLPADVRAPGFPLWMNRATADGKNVLEVVTQCEKMDPNLQTYVLLAFVDVHARNLIEEADRAAAVIENMRMFARAKVNELAPQLQVLEELRASQAQAAQGQAQ